nr:hypothetical protein [Tanacetum cinerariifolium]
MLTILVNTGLAKKIENSWVEDEKLQAIITKLHTGKELLQYYYGGAVGGHPRVKVTTHKICLSLYWKGLKKQVKQYVRECLVCQKFKPDLAAYPGLLQPIPIPQNIWSSISMDFIEGFPNSQGKNVIFVVVDRLRKYAHFIALSHPFTAHQVAQAFLDNVHKLHGMIESIGFDRDKVFLRLSKVEAVDMNLKAKEEAIKTVKFHLIRAQNRTKHQADQERAERRFKIGD